MRVLEELSLRGILSFGMDSPPLTMLPLNVLIGPNGSGKSNLIEAIGLLRSAATKLSEPIRPSRVEDWIWKGGTTNHAEVEAVISVPSAPQSIRHRLEFTASASRFELLDEAIENQNPDPGHGDPFFYYRFQRGRPVLSVHAGGKRQLERQSVAPDESILSQRKDPDQFPELARLADTYGNVRVYRNWSFGRTSVFRSPQPADLPSDRLEEDFSNLGLFLNHLRSHPDAKRKIIERLSDLYEGLDDFDVRIKGGSVEVFLTEGSFTMPAGRLSDGTLRYLCMLAILCDPQPPSLLCIEEPELGLHPDLLPKIADLMIEASTRTQLVVTTHSDIFVDAMTEQPESVVIVEKRDARTRCNRLEATGELQQWLEKYRLGQLWTRGELGGVRW
ncbi:MAG: AAA family ATPase [Planctomycetota bacterium]